MPNNTTNTTSPSKPFPNAFVGTVVKVDSVNSNVVLSSKNVDIGSTNGIDKIMCVNNTLSGAGDTATNITDINLNDLMIVRKNITGTGATATTNDEIKLTSSDILIGKDESSQPVIEIDGTNIFFKSHRLQHVADAVENDDALTLGQLNTSLLCIARAISNLNSSMAHLAQTLYGDALPTSPALTPYSVTHLPSTNVNEEGITNVSTITLNDILELE